MIVHPNFDPIAVSLGPLAVHWYGLMYLAGFAAGGLLGRHRARRANSGWDADEIFDLVFYIALGAVLGGRLGYALFYNPLFYFANPLQTLAIWDGGMSFHGGLLGAAAAAAWYARRTRRRVLEVGDFLAPLCIPGLGFGRLGNFINQELWGRVSDAPWAMWFHAMPDAPRHPSQLYEFALEGVALFAIVWIYSARRRALGRVTGVFLLGYGALRFAVEFFREPDAHLGAVALDWLTMGQVLSAPMIALGLYLWLRAARE
ncbi:MAG: prolipoprotein diacylglyceryl transferase [bacterium]